MIATTIRAWQAWGSAHLAQAECAPGAPGVAACATGRLHAPEGGGGGVGCGAMILQPPLQALGGDDEAEGDENRHTEAASPGRGSRRSGRRCGLGCTSGSWWERPSRPAVNLGEDFQTADRGERGDEEHHDLDARDGYGRKRRIGPAPSSSAASYRDLSTLAGRTSTGS